jgi:hypothetical protein
MYIKTVRLRDVKCFEDIELRFRHAGQGDERQCNWNVILGNNGDGKTSLLQAIAACLTDAPTAERLLKPASWVRHSQPLARLTLTVGMDEEDRRPGPRTERPRDRTVEYILVDGNQELQLNGRTQFFASATIVEAAPEYRKVFGAQADALADDIDFLKRHAFSRERGRGWLSCGYGSFRRLSGFSSKSAEVADLLERRFLTLFDEGAALYDCESWLKELDRKASKSGAGSAPRRTLDEVKSILCRILPGVDSIDTNDEVRFLWRGREVSLAHLSDGYRSMFALAVDLLRWLELTRPKGSKRPLNELSGVVLVDEIDAHLHPQWQREAGFLLTRIFPNLQFIVTSHSPFVVMAAGEGAAALLQKDGEVVRVSQELPYVRGWAVDQVLSQIFGLSSLRDPDTAAKIAEYEELRLNRGAGKLTMEQTRRLGELETYLNEHLRDADDALGNWALRQDLNLLTSELKARREKSRA